MEDLLQSQIHESCKLAMPVGLKELMSDISREVLRSQPENLYQFIANYLEALLITRETLSIACRICGEVSSCSCQPQLDDELSRIGLSHEDVMKAKNIILKHFDKGQVHEASLLVKLAAKTSVTEMQLLELQKAIHRSFQQYILKHKDVQVPFAKFDEGSTQSTGENTANVSTQSSVSDFYKPSLSLGAISIPQDMQDNHFFSSKSNALSAPNLNQDSIIGEASVAVKNREEIFLMAASVSATSLAGSYVNLPHRIPYSAHASACDDILIKSEKSVLHMLKSILFAEDREHQGAMPARNMDVMHSLGSTDSEEIDDTIKSVFSQDINEVRSRTSRESRTSRSRAMFRAIQEDLNESSSGDM